jgi:hypothetical protein
MSAVSAMPTPAALPEIEASFVTLASVIATPAPMPAEPLVVALPFAVVALSAASRACSVRRPPLVTLTPNGMVALLDAFEMTSAMAAATLIGPALVDALGVLVEPEPAPPAAAAVEFAWLRSPATWPSTPPDGEPGAPLPGAPAADAVADAEVVDGPVALNVTAPPAEMSLKVVASAV